MKGRCAISLALLLALLAGQACHDFRQEELYPISFRAVVSESTPLTRAANMTGEAELQASGFGVFGCYTGLHNYAESTVAPDFMYNQRLDWISGHWEYAPLKYWPGEEGHHVSFFAYAPYSDGSNPCIPSCSRLQEAGDPWILYRLSDDVAGQVDLLYAEPVLDCLRPAVGDKVGFNFKHALACVGENVSVSSSSSGSGYEIRLKEVTIDYTLTAKARLVLWNRGPANWNVINSEDVVTTRSLSLLSSGNASLPWTIGDKGVFCIPVEADGYPQKATIRIVYRVIYDDPAVPSVERSSTTELLLKGLLQAGKTLDININLTNNSF